MNQAFIGAGVFGVFDPEDQCPRAVCPESNQREMIYISLDTAPLGSELYQATLTHEHQHLIQHTIDGNERRWLNEALSQLAEHLSGFDPHVIADLNMRAFLYQPDHFLRGWSTDGMGRYYGAGYLFTVYLYERFGLDFIRAVANSDLDGMASIQTALVESGQTVSVDDVFADWIVANYLDDPYVAGGHYYYQTLDLPTRILPYPLIVYMQGGYTHTDTINQYGADYLTINQPGTFDLSFDGTDETPLINVLPKSGEWMWWSYDGNSSATRLTGAFDLRGLTTATLAFSAWWDMEDEYDWFQVLVSDNGGTAWHVVGGDQARPHTTHTPGVYYSGHSNAWIDERIDLSAYVGSEILVRLEYLTDNSHTLSGIALDDIGLVELNAFDTVEDAESIWQAEGFLRVPATVPQAWTVTALVQHPDGTTTAHPMPLDALNTGRVQITVPDGGSATIIIGAMAPFTANHADYKLSIQMEL